MENHEYNYQPELTQKLDRLDTDFNQETINEIILWKTNRYAEVDIDTLKLINQINKDEPKLNPELTRAILLRLLSKEQKGFRLAMASTVLRFKNPKIYQIIDQRVYRFIYGRELTYVENDINEQIRIYLQYLSDLKNICRDHNIQFENSDRILYAFDKKYNAELKLKGY